MKIANIGSDIASRWFDVCVLIENRRSQRRFNNTEQGCQECLEWLLGFGCDVLVMAFEPTGRYSELFAEFMTNRPEVHLFQVNVRKFREYARSLEPDLKTDYCDSFALGMFAKERAFICRQYQSKSRLSRELRDIQMRLRSLLKRSIALKAQQKCGLYCEFVKESIAAEVNALELEYSRVLDLAKVLIMQDPVLFRDKQLLETIPGIGEKTAVLLLCLIDFRQFRTGRSLARFLGLTQRKKESGSSIRGRECITKAGDVHVRAALYFPAISAMNHNPCLREFSDRIQGRGKEWALTRTAVTRKLVTMAWSIVCNQRPFNPQHKPI